MDFMQQLRRRWETSGSLVCVGLDPEPAKFPARFAADPDAVFGFCRDIVDATATFADCLERNGIVAEDVQVTVGDDGAIEGIEARILEEGAVKRLGSRRTSVISSPDQGWVGSGRRGPRSWALRGCRPCCSAQPFS